MKPTIGRIVIYTTTDDDKNYMRINHCNVVDELPAVIVNVWGDTEDACVNLKVMLDGHGDMWKTSIPRKSDINKDLCWDFPTIVK